MSSSRFAVMALSLEVWQDKRGELGNQHLVGLTLGTGAIGECQGPGPEGRGWTGLLRKAPEAGRARRR